MTIYMCKQIPEEYKTFQCKDLAWRVLPGYTAGREFCIGQLSPPRAAEGPMIAD